MLLLSHCTCTPGFVRSLDTVPVTPHPPMLAMFRDSPSCLGTELSPPRGNIPRGKRHKSHFSVSPPRKLPDYVGTSVWACSTPRTHMQRSCNYISIYLPCNQCQSNQHCRTPPIFAGFLFTTLRNGTPNVTVTYLPQLLASDPERQPLCPSSRQSAAQLLTAGCRRANVLSTSSVLLTSSPLMKTPVLPYLAGSLLWQLDHRLSPLGRSKLWAFRRTLLGGSFPGTGVDVDDCFISGVSNMLSRSGFSSGSVGDLQALLVKEVLLD